MILNKSLSKIKRFVYNDRKIATLKYKLQFYESLECQKKGIFKLPYTPLYVRIEPTNFCNLECIMCPQSLPGGRAKGYMNMNLYNKIINEIKTFKVRSNIVLYVGGESLLHRDIVDMIRIAKAAKLFVQFNTNATILTEEISYKILKSGLDSLNFSFDYEERENYEKMRKNSNFEKTLSNIKKFLEIKKQYNFRKPIVSVVSLKLKKDGDDIDCSIPLNPSKAFVDEFKDLGVDYIRSAWAHGWAGDFREKSSYKYTLPEKNVNQSCYHLWRDLTVGWDGKVLACCYDLKGDIILGDISKNSLLEIWNGDKMIELRKKVYNRNFEDIKLCKNCAIIRGEIKVYRS